ncbi:fimbrial protein [Escherichia albertii]
MKSYFNTLWLLLFVSARAMAGEELSQSVEITFSVNIEPPVCKLQNADLSLDFGEFQVSDIIAKDVKKTAEFIFADCSNVNNVTISFFGDNVDKNNNVIKNKSGANYASGVAIGLYDDKGSRIQLKEEENISVSDMNSFNFRVTAEVLKENSAAKVIPGNIDTSVNLNITYN